MRILLKQRACQTRAVAYYRRVPKDWYRLLRMTVRTAHEALHQDDGQDVSCAAGNGGRLRPPTDIPGRVIA